MNHFMSERRGGWAESAFKMELNPGEIVCNKCNGKGNLRFTNRNRRSYPHICPKCHGNGKVDWIENIVGKNQFTFIELYLPKLRTLYPKLLAEEIVSAQPIDVKLKDGKK